MRTAFCLFLTGVDLAFSLANALDKRFNRVRREAQERAEYEEFVRNWTDGTDRG